MTDIGNSGAEGTIIEGEQPSKMIWGLDQAPSAVKCTRMQKAMEVATTAPPQAQSNSDISAMTSAFYHARLMESDASAGTIQAGMEQLALLQSSRQRTFPQNPATLHSVSDRHEAPFQLHLNPRTVDLPGMLSALGLDDEPDYSGAERRQASLLVHEGAMPIATLYPFKNHNAFDLPVAIDQTRPPHRAEHPQQHYDSPSFLTPPLTVSSAQWTPQCLDSTPGTPYTPDLGLSSAEPSHGSLGLFTYHPPRAEEIFAKAASSGLRGVAGRSTPQPYGTVEESLHIKDRPIQLPVQKHHLVQPAAYHGGRPRDSLEGPLPNSLFMAEPRVLDRHLIDRSSRRPKLSDQEPQLKSVPLTRLLQRKLASVAEEDPSVVERETPPRGSRYSLKHGSPGTRGQAASSASGPRTGARGTGSSSERTSRQAANCKTSPLDLFHTNLSYS